MADGMDFAVVVQSKHFSCSGVVLDAKAGLVLTVGSVANGLLSKWGNELVEQCSFGSSSDKALKFTELDIPVQVILKRLNKGDRKRQFNRDEFITLHGSVIALWRDQTLYKLQQNFFPQGEWNFEHEKSNERDYEMKVMESHKSDFSLADFALIDVKDISKYLNSSFLTLKHFIAQVGDPVTVLGTPFGSECCSVFFNSMSKGIVSSTVGSTNKAILIDARCVPGTEGCPVFINPSQSNLNIYGLVIAPFCWRSGEWIGLTLVCSLVHILKNMINSNILPKNHPSRNVVTQLLLPKSLQEKRVSGCSLKKLQIQTFQEEKIRRAKQSVVLIQCGSTWGSGVVIDAIAGLIITCRHILTEGGVLSTQTTHFYSHNSERSSVPLSIHNITSQTIYSTVDVIFATAPDSSLDFSLLRAKNPDFKDRLKVEDQSFTHLKGSDIFALGFSIFGKDTSTEPCLTAGIISNVSSVNGMPVMLQTTAAVHAGGSGGAIISTQSGQLLGMVTCNIKDANTSSSFPHINFSIPSNLIQRLLSLVMDGGVSNVMPMLMADIDRVWCLSSNQPTQPVKSKL